MKKEEKSKFDWFESYVKDLEENSVTKGKQADTYYNCPCCYYPTLTERGVFDICKLCSWEDDGQDNGDADKVRGGPNSNYSLREARANFKRYYTMYRPEDESAFERSRIKKGFGGKVLLDKVALKKQIMAKYDEYTKMEDSTEKKKLLAQIQKLEKKL